MDKRFLGLALILMLLALLPVPWVHATSGIWKIAKRYAIDHATQASSTTNTIAFNLANAPTNGDTLIMGYSMYSGANGPYTISSIAETGVTWSKIVGSTVTGSASYKGDGELWIGVVGPGALVGVTITLSDNTQLKTSMINVADYPYTLTTDQTNSVGTQSGATKVTGTLASKAQPQNLVIGLCCSTYSVATTASTPTNNYVLLGGESANTCQAWLEDNNNQALSSGATFSQAGSYGVGVIASFDFPHSGLGLSGYSLKCMYEDATTLATLSVKVTDADGETTYPVTSTAYTYYFYNVITQFSWTCGAYTRVLHPTAVGETIVFLVPQAGATIAIYQFTIKDYSNVLTSPSYLDAWKVVSGVTYRVCDQIIADTLNGIPMVLIYSSLYEIKVRLSTGTTYSQGYILSADNYSLNILLHELAFSQTAQLSYKYLTVEATRPTTTSIQFDWNNTLTPTYTITSGTIYVKYRNGTTATSSAIGVAQSGSFTWSSANATLDYKVVVDIAHTYLGAVDYEKILPASMTAVTNFPSLGALGTIGDMDMSQALPIFSLFIVGGAVSVASIPLGALGMLALAGFYGYSGIMTITSTLLWTVIGLVALLFLASRRSG